MYSYIMNTLVLRGQSILLGYMDDLGLSRWGRSHRQRV